MTHLRIGRNHVRNQGGYIALISTLFIVSGIVAIGVTIALNGVNEMQLAFLERQSIETAYVAETCANDGLLRLKRDSNSGYTTYTGSSLSFSDVESCTVSVIRRGTQRELRVEGYQKKIVRRLFIRVETKPSFTILSWKEVPTF